MCVFHLLYLRAAVPQRIVIITAEYELYLNSTWNCIEDCPDPAGSHCPPEKRKSRILTCGYVMAQEQGFEPWHPVTGLQAFQACLFNHLSIPAAANLNDGLFIIA